MLKEEEVQRDTIGCDKRTASVCVDDVGERVKWRFRTQVANPK